MHTKDLQPAKSCVTCDNAQCTVEFPFTSEAQFFTCPSWTLNHGEFKQACFDTDLNAKTILANQGKEASAP